MEELNNLKYIKLFSILLLIYAFIGGFLFDVPALPILNESIRVLYFHVPMWFTMIFLLLLSCINSFYFISRKKIIYDTKSHTYTSVAVFFGSLSKGGSIKIGLKNNNLDFNFEPRIVKKNQISGELIATLICHGLLSPNIKLGIT